MQKDLQIWTSYRSWGNSWLCRSQGPPGIHLLQPVILTEFNAYTVNETLDAAKGYIPKESDMIWEMTFKQSPSDRKLSYSSLHLQKYLDVCDLFLMAHMPYVDILSTKLPYPYIYICLWVFCILYFHTSAHEVLDDKMINLKLLQPMVFQWQLKAEKFI